MNTFFRNFNFLFVFTMSDLSNLSDLRLTRKLTSMGQGSLHSSMSSRRHSKRSSIIDEDCGFSLADLKLDLSALEQSQMHPSQLPPFTDRPKWIWDHDDGGGWTSSRGIKDRPKNVKVPVRHKFSATRPNLLGVDPLSKVDLNSKATSRVPKFDMNPLKLPARAAELSEIPKAFDATLNEHVEECEVQNREEILNTARESVENRRRLSQPAMPKIDWDRAKTIREAEAAKRPDSPALVVLPDTRVRCVNDELNPRIRAQLLGERPPGEIQTAREYMKNKVERDERERMAIAARRRRMLRNPWYLAPEEWYKSGADQKNSGDADAPELLPYEIE